MFETYKNRNIFMNRAVAVKEYSYVEEINKQFREYMEDGSVFNFRFFRNR